MLSDEKGDKFAAWIQAHADYYTFAYNTIPERLHGAPDGNYLMDHGEIIARASKILDSFMNILLSQRFQRMEN